MLRYDPSRASLNGAGGTCSSVCSPATNSVCLVPGEPPGTCIALHWGFEPTEAPGWQNIDDVFAVVTNAQHHSGSQSLSVTPNSISSQPAPIGIFACQDASFNIGTMDLRGKTFTAFVRVPSSPGSFFTNTSCFLGANDPNFNPATIQGAGATVGPVPQDVFFTLTGTFANGAATSVEAHISQLTIKCLLPPDWLQNDPTKLWFVDDISVQ